MAVPNTLTFIIVASQRRPNGCTTKLLGTRALLRHALGRTAVCLFENNRDGDRRRKLLTRDKARRIASNIAKPRSCCGSLDSDTVKRPDAALLGAPPWKSTN